MAWLLLSLLVIVAAIAVAGWSAAYHFAGEAERLGSELEISDRLALEQARRINDLHTPSAEAGQVLDAHDRMLDGLVAELEPDPDAPIDLVLTDKATGWLDEQREVWQP